DSATGVALDSRGRAYISGLSASTDFPTTAFGYQTNLKGGINAIVARLNADGTLNAATYIGGSSVDEANDIAVDAHGMAWNVGQTDSLTGFPTASTLQGSNAGGFDDAFVTKIVIPAPQPVSEWLFNDGNGTIASDSIDGNAGTLQNGAGFVQGLMGGAVKVD